MNGGGGGGGACKRACVGRCVDYMCVRIWLYAGVGICVRVVVVGVL